MAAPHVTGIVSLLISNSSKYDLNSDGITSVCEIKERLQGTCTYLGIPGIVTKMLRYNVYINIILRLI